MAIPAISGALTSIQGSFSSAQNAASDFLGNLQNRLVVAPGGVEDIAGFIFDYAGEARSNIDADITDHWTELNASLQDHIAIKPIKIILKGFVAELAHKNSGAGALLSTVQNILTSVPAYLGGYNPQALGVVSGVLSKAQNIQNTLSMYVAQGKSLVSLFTNSPATQTKQEKAYAQLEALIVSRQIFTLVTPWRMYSNMAIEKLEVVQPENTRDMSDFTVHLKQMNFAQTLAIPNLLSTFAGRAVSQQSPTTLLGQQPPVTSAPSLLYQAWQGI